MQIHNTKVGAIARPRFFLLAMGLALASSQPASAVVAWHDVQLGGFASQGYLLSSANDYLGKTSDGTFDFREYAVNGSYAKDKWRIGAQVFGQKLGVYGEDKVKLDWAAIDYQPTQWLGFRAGRVKMPRGLYNEALDIDSVRPFVLLPQSVYDARLRDFNSAFNGAMVFGNVSIKKAGSLDYRVFYGDIPISTSSGASDYFNNDVPFPNVSISMDAILGGTLFWNTPIDGLRVGYSYSEFQNFSVERIATYGGAKFPLDKFSPAYKRHLLSLEYIRGSWVFATEAGAESSDSILSVAGRPSGTTTRFESKYYYASVSRRLNDRFEVGAYVSHSLDKTKVTPLPVGFALPPLAQTDYAASIRFDVNEHLLFKLEGHYIDGSGKLFDTPEQPQPLAKRDNSWTMIAAKMTVSF